MHWKFAENKIDYNGQQLRSNWIRENFNIKKDAIVAFIGSAYVKEHLVDLEDINNGEHIFSQAMLHFIVEHQDNDLEKAVCRQRLMICIIKEVILSLCHCEGKTRSNLLSNENRLLRFARNDIRITRKGDDLYIKGRKLSVSIATKSSSSTLIHTGLNISSKNTPVKAIGLKDLKINPKKLAIEVMESYTKEIEDIYKATKKVKFVL